MQYTPGIFFILMCKPDYIISCIVTGAESLELIDGKCGKGCDWVVVGHSVEIKCSIDDQTIIDNCQISKMKISTLKVLLAVFQDSWLEQWDEHT